MFLEPEQESEEPSAIRILTPDEDEEAGAENTETEAPESKGKRWVDNLS